ncbi:MAG TPA: DUF3382 domain-containing protein, partial [Stellaceae bacterium]|nr:DUF3382 domain-containing protein [Stellaceae bacterium]
MPRPLKEAAWAAAVTLVLAIPLVGFKTEDVGGGALGIVTRFDWVALAVATVFVGKLALSVIRWPRLPAFTLPPRMFTAIAVLALLGAMVLPFLPFGSRYVVDTATTVLIYVMLGWGLNVVVGLAGLLDLGYVAFYAVGAYSFALFARWFNLSFWEALPIAGPLAAIAGILLGFPVLRLRGDFLAIVTLGFGEIVHIVLQNWTPVTHGAAGINDIERPSLFGLIFAKRAPEGAATFHDFFGITFNQNHRVIFLYYIILGLALATNFLALRLRRLPIGRAFEALREDEVACRALGINP